MPLSRTQEGEGFALIREGILDQDGVVALGAGRNKSGGGFDKLLDPANVFDRLGRQLGEGTRAARVLAGQRDRPLVDRHVHHPAEGDQPLVARVHVGLELSHSPRRAAPTTSRTWGAIRRRRWTVPSCGSPGP